MRKFALILIIVSSAMMANAAPSKASLKAPTTIACAVSGMKIKVSDAMKAHHYADYKGNRYFFCCNDCPAEFKKNPAKFSKAPHVKTPKK